MESDGIYRCIYSKLSVRLLPYFTSTKALENSLDNNPLTFAIVIDIASSRFLPVSNDKVNTSKKWMDSLSKSILLLFILLSKNIFSNR